MIGDLIQWPAMVVAILGAFYVGGVSRRHRFIGFVLFLVSNLLLIAWALMGWHWGIFIMQMVFTCTSIRGLNSNRGPSHDR